MMGVISILPAQMLQRFFSPQEVGQQDKIKLYQERYLEL